MVNWSLRVCNARSGMTYGEGDGLGASLIWTVEAKMAEAELAERSFRTTMGMRGKAQKGSVPGGRAPFGYCWTGGDASELVVDKDAADIVRDIFARVADGQTCAAVAADLNSRGIPSPGNAARGWSTQTVHKIVRLRAYIGTHSWGRNHGQRLNSERERQEWANAYLARNGVPPARIPAKIVVPGTEVTDLHTPRIVDDALWNRANERLTRTRKRHAVTRRPAVLLGLLRCEECGAAMKATWGLGKAGVPYHFYRCASHVGDPSRGPCRPTDRRQGRKSYVSAESIEERVWQLVDGMLSDPTTLAAAVGATRASEQDTQPADDDRLRRHELRLERALRAWDTARRAHFAGDLDADTYRRDKQYFEGEISMLEDELRRMRQALDQRRAQAEAAQQVAELSTRWAEIRETLTPQERQTLIHALVTDITISPDDQVTVEGALSPELCSREVECGSA